MQLLIPTRFDMHHTCTWIRPAVARKHIVHSHRTHTEAVVHSIQKMMLAAAAAVAVVNGFRVDTNAHRRSSWDSCWSDTDTIPESESEAAAEVRTLSTHNTRQKQMQSQHF
jgi:hypothetical protein